MKVYEGKWKVSSRDLFKSDCDHCTRIDMAVAAEVPEVLERVSPFQEDMSKAVFVQQGNEYEEYVFTQLRSQLGNDFVELQRATMVETLQLLKAGKAVVAQGFLESNFGQHLWSGYPDLLIREDFSFEKGELVHVMEPSVNPKYVVWDVKASNNPDEKYWLQVASYSKVLEEHNLSSEADLGIIGKHFQSFRLGRVDAMTRLYQSSEILLNRLSLATPESINAAFIENWRCETPSSCAKATCSFPKHCQDIFEQEHSLYLLYGRNPVERMRAAGITTYDDLLVNEDPQWQKSRDWARVLKQEISSQSPYFETMPKEQWLEIPEPTSDDLFFDIEWFTPVLEEDPLVFEFGFVDANENFKSLDGFTREDELPNFKKFVEVAKSKMDSNPLARIYHYSNPEVTYLSKLVAKYNILQGEVRFLISRMVDLRKIATSRIRPGSNSYSIKELERYYDADIKLNRKANGVSGGADAMALFYQATYLEPSKAEEHMNTIRAYNRDDCLSTKLLRDWLLSIAEPNQ